MKILYLIIYLSLRIYKKTLFLAINIIEKNKVKKLLRAKRSKKLSRAQIREIKSYYKRFGIKNVNVFSHQFYYGCNGLFMPNYMPENLYYTQIEPKLNGEIYAPALSDKNLLSKLFPNVKQPRTIIKNINGFYYNSKSERIDLEQVIDLCEISENIVIKPTLETGGGKNVLLFGCKNGITTEMDKSLMNLLQEYNKDFIIQNVVSQHPKMEVLNKSSLNTFRVMSYLNFSGVKILSTIVRMGRKGSFTDNASMGGIVCGVHKDGQLNENGYDQGGKRFIETDEGIKFKDIVLPFMEDVEFLVNELHLGIPYFRLISWDLAVDQSGSLVLIEFNVKGQGIGIHELNNGAVISELLPELRN
jgi:hypothetical protein